MTTVQHEEYWPAILADPTQYGQIQTADAAWNARAACVYEVLKNTLCARDNAILTQQWENTLELSPADGATLNERKAVILYRLTEAPPLTIALLEKSLILLMGEGKAVVEHLPEENKLVVHTDRADDTQLEAVTALLSRVLPQNIEVAKYNHHIKMSWRALNGIEDILGDVDFLYEYVEEENKLVIHTDRANTEQLKTVDDILASTLSVDVHVDKYNHHIEVSWRDINKYAACTNTNDLKAANADYKNDLTSDGTWAYPLTALGSASYAFYKAGLTGFEGELPKLTNGDWMFRETKLTYWNTNLPELTTGDTMFCMVPLTSWTGELPKLSNGKMMLYETKLTYWNTELPNLTNGRQMYQWCKLTSWTVELPKLSDGYNMFRDSRLDKESALLILNSIPAWSDGAQHLLGIGIHVDHKNDEEVLAAIANAEAKGWTLTVNWNGTPTSTASTMAMGTLIYAKVGELERPDGTTERVLDWGHYVTNPEGYETFRSLESAYEYFNLEMPEEEKISIC